MSKADRLSELTIDRSADVESPRRWPLWLGLVAILGIGAFGAWRWSQPDTLSVTLVSAKTIDASQVAINDAILDGSGYVTARRQATVSSQTTGKVVEVLIEEGMRVEEGQVLARLDDSLQRAQLELSQAQLDSSRAGLEEIRVDLDDAKRTLRRSRELIDRKLVSQETLDQANARVQALTARIAARRKDVQVAEKALALQDQQLDDLTIRAPFAGMVIAKAAQPGEMISPISAGGGFTRTGICTLVDMESLEIEVDVNEAYIDRVRAEQPVIARLDAYPDWRISARVIAIIPAADRQKATVPVRIALLDSDPRILPDMGVQVSFQAKRDEPAAAIAPARGVTVPLSAIRQEENGRTVFMVREGRAERRAISTSGNSGSDIIVTGGLQRGDRVISPLPQELNDGDAVTVED